MKKLFKIIRNLNGQMISSSHSVIFIPLKKEEASENMLLLETPSSSPYSMPTNAVKGIVLRDKGGEIVPKLAYVPSTTPMYDLDIADLIITLGKRSWNAGGAGAMRGRAFHRHGHRTRRNRPHYRKDSCRNHEYCPYRYGGQRQDHHRPAACSNAEQTVRGHGRRSRQGGREEHNGDFCRGGRGSVPYP